MAAGLEITGRGLPMSYSAEECWQSLITRYGSPLEPDDLDEDTLRLAIAERRALVIVRILDGCGGGEIYFYRAQLGYYENRPTFVFPRPCEITDEEVAALDHPNPWESGADLDRFTCRILGPGCWKSLITRYGSPLEPENLDEDTLKVAIAERRALKVVGYFHKMSGYAYFHKGGDADFRRTKEGDATTVLFQRAKEGDAIKGFTAYNPYFCIVFPRPCEITDKEARILNQFPFEPWEKVCEFTDAILREIPDSP